MLRYLLVRNPVRFFVNATHNEQDRVIPLLFLCVLGSNVQSLNQGDIIAAIRAFPDFIHLISLSRITLSSQWRVTSFPI